MKPYLVAFISFAGVLMSLEFSVPLMPVFYKIDFSDVPAVIALFTMGPVSGLAVEFVKILIKLITVGTNSNYVGEFSNLIAAVMFILPIWFISRKMPATKKGRVDDTGSFDLVMRSDDPVQPSRCPRSTILMTPFNHPQVSNDSTSSCSSIYRSIFCSSSSSTFCLSSESACSFT